MIELKNVCLDYPIEQEDDYSLKKTFINYFGRKKSSSSKCYQALKNITLRIDGGEKVGIIGLNGAGKSTLLRVLSEIYEPTLGSIKVNGKVVSLLDLATGFELHHTGIENIRIRLMFLGATQSEIDEKIEDISEFTELGDFLNLPTKTYSSGMFLRLAFATSTALIPDILIADEVIGAGDALFVNKAKERLDNFLHKSDTLVISSHSMELIREFCKRVIWVHEGVIIADGEVNEVISKYENFCHDFSNSNGAVN